MVSGSILACLLTFLGIVEPAAATGMAFGDGLALFLCLGIVIVAILACLGQHSRRVGAGQF